MKSVFLALVLFLNFAAASPRNYKNHAHPIAVAAVRMLSTIYQSCEIIDGHTLPRQASRASFSSCQNYNFSTPSYNQSSRAAQYRKKNDYYSVVFPGNESDCSSLVDSIVYSAGLFLKKNTPPSDGYQPATGEMLNWGKSANDCFEPVILDGSTKFLQPGDLIVNGEPGRHVVVIAKVENSLDPLHLRDLNPQSAEDCHWDKLFQSFKASVVDNAGEPVEMNYIQIPKEVFVAGCQAYVKKKNGRKPKYRLRFKDDEMGTRWTILRHKLSSECINPLAVIPTGYSCVSACEELSSLESGLKQDARYKNIKSAARR